MARVMATPAGPPVPCIRVLWRNPDNDVFIPPSCPFAGAGFASDARRPGPKFEFEQQPRTAGAGLGAAARRQAASQRAGAHSRTPCAAAGSGDSRSVLAPV